jgi:hypothetical protein
VCFSSNGNELRVSTEKTPDSVKDNDMNSASARNPYDMKDHLNLSLPRNVL